MSHPITRLWKKATTFVAMEVPAEVAACEFDCRELSCDESYWASCPRRVQKSEAIAEAVQTASHLGVSQPSSSKI